MAARAHITDRALRYRANRLIPNHAKVCAFCGVKNGLEVGHVGGDESDEAPENLTWTCRACNVIAGNTLRSFGIGRLTHQYNPAKSGGASNVGEWIQAVGAITPHTDRGDRGLASTMSVSEAVAMIRATPHSKRSQFAAQLRKHQRTRARERYNPSWTGDEDDLLQQAKTARTAAELGRLFRYAEKHGIFSLEAAVRDRVKQLGLKPKDFRENPGIVPLGLYDLAALDAAGKGIFKKLHNGRRNPMDAATEQYESFHGRPSEKIVEVVEDVHYHSALAQLGALRQLRVKAADGTTVYLANFGADCLLCSNEDGTQLYIRGGDQEVDLAQFGIDSPHDFEDLGEVKQIRYYTTKDHLGSEGGEAEYYHNFGEEDVERGQKARRPRLRYSTRDKLLSFVGGAYVVKPEGIAN